MGEACNNSINSTFRIMSTSNRSMGKNANGMAIKINHTIKLAAPPQKRIENEGSTAQQRQLFA